MELNENLFLEYTEDTYNIVYGDGTETWGGEEADTLDQAIEIASNFDDGAATGYQVYNSKGILVHEDYLDVNN